MRLINRHPGRPGWMMLAVLPFALLLMLYLGSSAQRLAENPRDKLLPSMQQMADAIERMAFTPDKRSGDYLLWQDTLASLKRPASAAMPRPMPTYNLPSARAGGANTGYGVSIRQRSWPELASTATMACPPIPKPK